MAELSTSEIFGNLQVTKTILTNNLKIKGNAVFHEGNKPLWNDVLEKPSVFTPADHTHNTSDINAGTLSAARLPAEALIGDTTYSAGTGISLSGTTFNVDNPFNPAGSYAGLRAQATTKVDVGLSNVDNIKQAPNTHVGATGTAHGVATTSINGFMSSTDKSKLDGVATNANNYTHPASHPHSMITGLSDAATTTVSTIRSGTTKANVGLGNVDDKSSATIRAEITSGNVTSALGFTPENTANKSQANGYASLDVNAKIPLAQLPDTSKQQTYVKSTIAERDAITGLIEGDKCYITGTKQTFIWDSTDWILVSDADWENVNLDWNNIINVPSDVTDAAQQKHTHSNKAVLDGITNNGSGSIITSAERTKLGGIEAGANDYTHPSTHPHTMITGLSDAATTTISTIRSGTTKANVGLGDVDNFSRAHYDGRYVSKVGDSMTGKLNFSFMGTAGQDDTYIELQGNQANDATNENGGAFIKFRTSTSNNYGAYIGGHRRSNGSSAMVFKTGAQNPGTTMYLNESGNLGIGTTSPSDALHVVGDVRWTGILNAGSVPWARLTDVPSTFAPSTHTHAPGDINTNSTNRFVTDAEKSTWSGKQDDLGSGTTAQYLRGDGTWAAPPNTTYSEITTAEIDTGTASTLRTITARRLQYLIDNKKVGSATVADSANAVTWANVSGKPAQATRWAAWSEVTSKPSTFTPSAHNHSATDINTGTLSTARLPAAALIGDTTYTAGTGISLSGTTFNVDNPFIIGTSSTTAHRGDHGAAAYSHISNNGSDHSFINQSVTTSASPTFRSLSNLDTSSGSEGATLSLKNNSANWHSTTHVKFKRSEVHGEDMIAEIVAGSQSASGGRGYMILRSRRQSQSTLDNVITLWEDSVGIGSEFGSHALTPTQKLDVRGNIRADQFYIGTTRKDNYWDAHVSNNGSDHSYINQSVTTTASPTFNNVTVNENIGIGTTTPDEKLDVAGTAKATAFKTGDFEINYNEESKCLSFDFVG